MARRNEPPLDLSALAPLKGDKGLLLRQNVSWQGAHARMSVGSEFAG